MKMLIVVLIGLGSLTIFAQTTPPKPPGTSKSTVVFKGPAPAKAAPSLELEGARRAVEQAGEDAKSAFDQAHAVFKLAAEPFRRGSSRAGRTLVIQSTGSDPKALSALEEDLNVMSRILAKALPGKSDDGEPSAMGILLYSVGSSSRAQNLYLDGYGAVFLLNVRFPLLPPPEKTEQPKPKETTSTDWDKAWRELYGRSDADGDFLKAMKLNVRGPAEEYDAEKVESLKSSLLEALKNATHIRNLKPADSITVVVMGGDSGVPGELHKVHVELDDVHSRVEPRPRFGVGASVSERGGSVMTIRVKKSDVDSFAKGSLDLDGFRKKATILIYASGGSQSVAGIAPPSR